MLGQNSVSSSDIQLSSAVVTEVTVFHMVGKVALLNGKLDLILILLDLN